MNTNEKHEQRKQLMQNIKQTMSVKDHQKRAWYIRRTIKAIDKLQVLNMQEIGKLELMKHALTQELRKEGK